MTPAGLLHVRIPSSPLRDHTRRRCRGHRACVRDITSRLKAEGGHPRVGTPLPHAHGEITTLSWWPMQTGMLVDASRKAQNLMGYSLDGLRHAPDRTAPPAERERYEAIFLDHIRQGKTIARTSTFCAETPGCTGRGGRSAFRGRRPSGSCKGIFREAVSERRRFRAALVGAKGASGRSSTSPRSPWPSSPWTGGSEYINERAIGTFGYVRSIPTMDRWWAQAYPDDGYRGKQSPLGDAPPGARRRGEPRERGPRYRVTCKDDAPSGPCSSSVSPSRTRCSSCSRT